jgi:hypothetical protein
MTARLYHRYEVDETTPVQYAGVYVTRWRPEWGEPTVLFREVDDDVQELADAAPKLLEACKAAKSFIDDDAEPYPSPGGYTLAQMKQALNEAIAAAEPPTQPYPAHSTGAVEVG